MIRPALLMIVMAVIPSICFAAPIGQVSRMNGAVSVKGKKAEGFTSARSGQQLEEGDRIKTGKDGWVELKLIDDSRFTLANNTDLELTSFSLGIKEKRGVLNLAGGKVRATVTRLAGQQTDIKLKSPTAVAGIKGTEFLMLSRGPANVFFGNEGTVSIAGADGLDKPLSPQTMTQTTRGYEPLEPVGTKEDPELAKAKAVFEEATGTAPPADWAASNNLPNIIARWNINIANLAADKGEYQKALQLYQIALDLTDMPEISLDARNGLGVVYGRNLNKPQAALDEYLQALKEFPDLPNAAHAVYGAGQAYYDMGQNDKAAEYFRKYLELYPNGKQRGSVETMLNTLQPPPVEKR